MSNTRCEIFNWLLVPTAITVLLSLTVKNAELELGFTYALCVLTTLAHIHYGTCLVSILNTVIVDHALHNFSTVSQVRQLCGHFRIKCFKISYQRSD